MTSNHLGTDSPDQTTTPARRPASSGAGWRGLLALVLIVLLVLGVIACGYLFFRLAHPNEQPLNPVSGASALPSDQERSEATATAQQFALRMDNVDGTKFDTYVKRIDQLLTTKAKAKNKQAFDAMRQAYTAAKVTGTGKILLSGVADIDSDSATVLVAHDATVKTTQGNIAHHYRWNVDLVKVGGHWLVDDFNPVN